MFTTQFYVLKADSWRSANLASFQLVHFLLEAGLASVCGPKRPLKGRVPCHSSEIHYLRDGFPAIGELSCRVLVSGRPTHAECELDRRAAQDRCGERIPAVERFGGGR
jgi:hypothetical protein